MANYAWPKRGTAALLALRAVVLADAVEVVAGARRDDVHQLVQVDAHARAPYQIFVSVL